MVLKGIRVLDFGRYVAGPYCAALLADLGADVIRVDKPDGSEDRFVCPVTEEGEGTLFFHCNRNKRGITLDPGRLAGQALIKRLVASSDVVIANMPDDALRKIGLDYAALRAIKPDIIASSQSAFGNSGPYAQRTGFDGVAQAMSGATYLSGQPGQPTKSYASWVDFGTAMLAAYGTVAALLHKKATGEGQSVEVNLLHTALSIFHFNNLEEYFAGRNRQPTANRSQFGGPADLFRTKDGWIQVQVVGRPLFKRWCRLVGEEALFDDPRFLTDDDRGTNGALLSERMQLWCAERTTSEAIEELQAARIPVGEMLSPRAVFDDPHVKATGMLTPVAYPGLAMPAPMIRPPVSFSATENTIYRRPPLLGEHTGEILEELGYSTAEIAALRAEGAI